MGSKTRAAGPSSPLRAALAAKKSLRTHFDLAVVDSDQVEQAVQRLDIARQMAAGVMLQDDPDVTQRAEEVLERAKAAVAACFHRIYFRGLHEAEFDALVALHPPTDEQRADEWLWDPEQFNYALLAACAVDSDLTAEEWKAELADPEKWSRADKHQLINNCLAANRQTMSDAVPKG